jgi:fucose permease
MNGKGEEPVMKRSIFIVLLVFLIFFVISFITNILNPLLPDIIDGFSLSLALAGFLPFSFFVAYGVMSIPAGMLLERIGQKKILVAAFVLALAGSFSLAAFPSFTVALLSLFTIGIGMTMLQVAINPLLRVAGGEEHFAFFSVMAQLVFGAASFISPHIFSYLVTNLKGYTGGGNLIIDSLARIVPHELPWISLYWVFTVVIVLMVIILALVRLPRVELTDEERPGAVEIYRQLLKNRFVWLYFIGIFAYVGSEQGVANWISKFLSTYHGLDPQVEGAHVVAWFWGLLTAGCLLGLLLLKLYDCRRVLVGFTSAAMVSLTVALVAPAQISGYAFMLVGFCLSVMWSVIFSLALNSVAEHHGSFSGILCTGIVGGAFVPMIVGQLGEVFGLRIGMLFIYLTLGYILSIGLWARPLIDNATLSPKELLRSMSNALSGRRNG